MSLPIITAIRGMRQPHLKESVLHTATELAHRASIYGVVRVSYSYLAKKCHCSRRTIIRHIIRLIELKILRKSVLWIRGNFCEVNTYTFCICWHKPAPTQGSDKMAPTLPPQENRSQVDLRGKEESLSEEIRNLERGLQFTTEGSMTYTETMAKLEYLRRLMRA